MLQAYIDLLIWRFYGYELELMTLLDTLGVLLTSHINISILEKASGSKGYLFTVESRLV